MDLIIYLFNLLPPGGQILVLILVVGGIYFLPATIADCKGHPHAGGIWVINFFLGWTGLGWIIALAWACCGKST